jgi:hypothetical protein
MTQHWKPIDLVPLALGIGCYVLGHWLPDVADKLDMVAALLVGTFLPQLSKMGKQGQPKQPAA